jgi:hypothetical protein
MVLDFNLWIVTIGKKVETFWSVFEIQWKQFEIWKIIKILGNMKQNFLPSMVGQLEHERCLKIWKEPFTFTDKPSN